MLQVHDAEGRLSQRYVSGDVITHVCRLLLSTDEHVLPYPMGKERRNEYFTHFL